MPAKQIPKDIRPSAADLTGALYDLPSGTPAEKTVVICAGPCTGSYELGRFLMAAGAGIAHEYFHAPYARTMARRWDLAGNPLDRSFSEIYLQMLKLQRGQNGVFAVNLRYAQFLEHLMNRTGAQLFNGATVIHLFSTDIVTQLTAWRAATETGVWDFSGEQTTPPRPYPETAEDNVELFDFDADLVTGEDSGFRKLFAMTDIAPVFLTTEQLFRDPKTIVSELTRLAGVEPDIAALDAMIALSAPYSVAEDVRQKAYDNLSNDLKRKAFRL
jgi:LPS sulfotransferase NodH